MNMSSLQVYLCNRRNGMVIIGKASPKMIFFLAMGTNGKGGFSLCK